jgi:hypothetical protein
MIMGSPIYTSHFVSAENGASESISSGLIRAYGDTDQSLFKPQSGGTISQMTPEEIAEKKKGISKVAQSKSERKKRQLEKKEKYEQIR